MPQFHHRLENIRGKTYLRAVSVCNDELVALLNELSELCACYIGILELFLVCTLLASLHEGVATKGNKDTLLLSLLFKTSTTKKEEHESLACVKPILGFIENNALWAIDDLSSHLSTTHSGQAVHEDSIGFSKLHELSSDLKQVSNVRAKKQTWKGMNFWKRMSA